MRDILQNEHLASRDLLRLGGQLARSEQAKFNAEFGLIIKTVLEFEGRRKSTTELDDLAAVLIADLS